MAVASQGGLVLQVVRRDVPWSWIAPGSAQELQEEAEDNPSTVRVLHRLRRECLR